VPYDANVYIRRPGDKRSLVARTRNLSTDGVGVTGDELPAEGEEVECRMALAGVRRRLRGRVAWVARSPLAARSRRVGSGIEFLALDGQDRALLARLVKDAHDRPQPVEVWFPGLEHPLRMRALIGNEEVKLGITLPALAVGTPLRISFVHRGVAELRDGTISSVKYLPGDAQVVSRVALQVATPRPQGGAGVIRVNAPASDPGRGPNHSVIIDLAALEEEAEARPAAALQVSSSEPTRRRHQRTLWILAGALGLLALALLGVATLRPSPRLPADGRGASYPVIIESAPTR
jgi:hypothetical protein